MPRDGASLLHLVVRIEHAVQRGGALDVIVNAKEIDACVDLQSLIDIVAPASMRVQRATA